ncbi:unnamed protein product [Paramecium sonneborni]|uniref:3'-5' exonuclease domain-containing protein n=1 Tax=Paramecium sonneborni TaxID=65129 RepID=A0A8S1NC99_9CILI|nr:unnamed protein product [Paramecium sonneborni]
MQQIEKEEEIFNDDKLIEIIQKIIVGVNGFVDLKQYIGTNKPSFGLIQNHFEKVLEQGNTQLFQQNIQKILEGLIQNNVQRVFIRVLFQYLKQNQDQLNLKQFQDSGIAKIWKNLQFQELNEFIILFQLQDQITEQDLLNHYLDLVQQKKFDDAFLLYQNLKLPKNYFYNLVDQMGNNKDAGKAADFIKKLNYDPENYPKIVERLEKSCIRYLSKEYSWFQCEEKLLYNQSLLVYYCEDAYYHNYKKEALSIIKRNNLLNQIKKENQKEYIKQDFQEGFEEIPNVLFVKDEFKPTEEFVNNENGVYLLCSDFGYQENQIFVVDKVDQNYFDAWKCIHSSKAVGYDCENVTPWTKLDYQGFKVCLVQIATQNHVFLFDFQRLQNHQEFKDDIRKLLENFEIPKIGLSLKDDLKHTVNHLKLKNIIVRSVIELSNCFKMLEKDPKLKSLAYITEFYFKKKLSKYETCSNWEYRPLRKAQIHYAALDAIASLHVYLKMNEINNQIIEEEKDVLQMGQ